MKKICQILDFKIVNPRIEWKLACVVKILNIVKLEYDKKQVQDIQEVYDFLKQIRDLKKNYRILDFKIANLRIEWKQACVVKSLNIIKLEYDRNRKVVMSSI